jgi:hypothetical protein
VTRAIRWLLGAVGVLVAAYGGWLVLSRGHDLTNLVVWLVAGVVGHDAVIAALSLVVGATAVRLAPAALRAPLTVGLVVLGSTTLLAVPVLGRFGARPDNPTLLDRDYTAGWVVLLGLTVVCVTVAAVLRSRRR